jgi:predicted Zn-dependent peptidase
LRRALSLKLKAMRICATRDENNRSTRSLASSINLDVDNDEPENLSKVLAFTSKENSDFKAQELDYEIEAI